MLIIFFKVLNFRQQFLIHESHQEIINPIRLPEELDTLTDAPLVWLKFLRNILKLTETYAIFQDRQNVSA